MHACRRTIVGATVNDVGREWVAFYAVSTRRVPSVSQRNLAGDCLHYKYQRTQKDEEPECVASLKVA
jgi:hypothetical protein